MEDFVTARERTYIPVTRKERMVLAVSIALFITVVAISYTLGR